MSEAAGASASPAFAGASTRPIFPVLVYPTQAAVYLALAGAPIALVVALAAPALWPIGPAWALFALVLVLVDGVLAAPAAGVSARADLPRVMNVGETARIMIRATADGATRRMEARLDLDPRLSASSGQAPVPLSEGRADIDLTALRRGTAPVDALWLRWSGPLGMAWKQRMFDRPGEILVCPDIRPLRDAGTAALSSDRQDGRHIRRDRSDRGEFDALSDYRPGIDRRTIDWKRSARHAKLLAKEFRVERNANVVFAVDSGRTMCEPVDGVARLDRAVSAALLAAWAALAGGDRVALFGFDARPRIASGLVSGPGAFASFQSLAARLDYSSEETNFTLALGTLAGRLERRSLVVLFTEVVDSVSSELMLRTLGPLAQRHLLLFVLMADAELTRIVERRPETSDDVVQAASASALLRERRIVIERLRRLGAQVIEAPHDRIGPRLVGAYLDIKMRGLL